MVSIAPIQKVNLRIQQARAYAKALVSLIGTLGTVIAFIGTNLHITPEVTQVLGYVTAALPIITTILVYVVKNTDPTLVEQIEDVLAGKVDDKIQIDAQGNLSVTDGTQPESAEEQR